MIAFCGYQFTRQRDVPFELLAIEDVSVHKLATQRL